MIRSLLTLISFALLPLAVLGQEAQCSIGGISVPECEDPRARDLRVLVDASNTMDRGKLFLSVSSLIVPSGLTPIYRSFLS